MKFFLGLFLIAGVCEAAPMSSEGLKEVRSYSPLHKCYLKYVADVPKGPKKGNVFFKVKKDPNGQVLEMKFDSSKSKIWNTNLNQCLQSSLEVLTYPKEDYGKESVFEVDLQFPLR